MRIRYLLFSGENYYARGGWHDSAKGFVGYDDAVAWALKRVEEAGHEWWHIVDLATMTIIAKSDEQAYGVD